MSVKSYNEKVVISGDIIEIYKYEKPIIEGFSNSKSKGQGRSSVADDEEKKANRQMVLTRARRDLRRLINSNIYEYGLDSKFLTLTFKEHITTFETANYEFKKFRQRLEYELRLKLKYVVVPEFTKQGRIHFHVVLFNVPYIKNSKLQDIWSNGFVKINRIDNVDNVGAYICKYMTKDNVDERLVGKKCYFSSRGLYKPIEIKQKEKVDEFADSLPAVALTYANTFENEYNTTSYKQYNMYHVKNK